MYKFILKLADLPIEVNSQSDFSSSGAREYITPDEKALLSVEVSDDTLLNAIREDVENHSAKGVEWACIHRAIAEQIPLYDRVVMHGAVISYKGQGLMFTAPSGTGKTTHISLWRSVFGNDVDIVNGDKPILQVADSGVVAYGTPWSGKEGWQKNTSVPLKGICLLKRGKVNKIRPMKTDECLSQLLKQVYLPRNEQAAQKTLELFGKIIENVPLYILECDISESAVRTAFEMLVEQG